MLIINNGVPKSGSSWVQRILEQGLAPDAPPQDWRNDWSNPSIDPSRLRDYVESGAWEGAPRAHAFWTPSQETL